MSKPECVESVENHDAVEPKDSTSPLSVAKHSPDLTNRIDHKSLSSKTILKDAISVVVPPVQERWEYRVYPEELYVDNILEEYDDQDENQFLVKFSDGSEKTVTYARLIKVPNGIAALTAFENTLSKKSSPPDFDLPAVRKSTRQVQPRNSNATPYLDTSKIDLSSDDELASPTVMKLKMPQKRGPISAPNQKRRRSSDTQRSSTNSSISEFSSDGLSGGKSRAGQSRKRKLLSQPRPLKRLSRGKSINYTERLLDEESESDEAYKGTSSVGKRKRGRPGRAESRGDINGQKKQPVEGTRKSSRRGRALGDMREMGEEDVPENVPEKGGTKYAGAKEHFIQLPKDSEFRLHHCQTCDTCNEYGDNEEKGALVYCQGCTLAYHQKCLGQRNTRDHLVTKIGEQDFVLQCRRCIGMAQKKDPMAPRQAECTVCRQMGQSCQEFRERKTSRQEQKDREENDGEDPIATVPSHLINNVVSILFRCVTCYRAFHMHHLPSRTDSSSFITPKDEQLAADRFGEYCQDWSCKDCFTAPAEIASLVAWRPVDQENYKIGTSTDLVNEDDKEYLVRWAKMSYFRTSWMPGAWVWGTTAAAMRKAFAKRDNENNLPKMRTEDAIPEDYLRVDIVLNVEYTNVVKVHVEKVDKARIKEVKKALVKFKGLGYEDVVWEEPPDEDDTQRWEDFKTAYEDWVLGRYVHLPAPHLLSAHLSKVRGQNFEKKIMMHNQPENLTGGKLMDYQLDGLNWLYYRWHQRQNAILADEMGLGKTIQIIGFLATLQQRHKCWPFLIVVPNSTCPNWRREVKQWAPSLRVVAYYGSSEARRLIEKHELYPGGTKDLRCHIVVTSYEAAQHEDFRTVFRGISWAGLIVDEGQRLKNDKNILYEALNALKAPFKVLLTGTPLQNNPRELFNLLQFLDKSFNASEMEVEYATLTKENVPQLHDLLRVLLLRRTKAQVLTFLPSMAQIIVPVTMSVVQKKLYKSIIAKNSDLIKSVFGGSQRLTKQNDRANLNNILMQLRKCLAHPFVYSRAIEERSSNAAISHRNLIDASSKLQLLEIMLPKLEERGHRVLIFSQFLDMLDMVEDFLDGLGLYYQRLDGNVSSLQKQKRIDEFNAPNSPLFAFLLSTRAGGVGINLATADTVIILDPDFNPHQDIQALSRAHRIGQKKKVLVFQLTTRNTAEEKIMQIGKKKMALDHALIEQMGAAEDDSAIDLESILRHGAEALFQDDDANDIHYDSTSVDKLLDRSQIENTQTGNDNSAESQFSFARVWANDKSSLEDALEDEGGSQDLHPSIWENILKTREQEAANEATAKAEMLGRGKRKRQTVDYGKQSLRDLGPDSPARDHRSRGADDSESDTDFQAREAASDGEESGEETEGLAMEPLEDLPISRSRHSGVLDITTARYSGIQSASTPHHASVTNVATSLPKGVSKVHASHTTPKARTFKRAAMPTNFPELLVSNGTEQAATLKPCLACSNIHPVGYCPMKLAGVEHCGLCGMAHYGSGFSRNCPHLKSITQCRAMLEALKSSTEPPETVKQAKRYVVGILGDLNRRRKLKEAAHSIPVDTLQAPANFSNGYKPLEHQSHGHPIELPSLPFSGHPIELPAHPANRPLFEPPGDHGHFPTAPYRIN